MKTLTLYNFNTSYSFGIKEPVAEKDATVAQRLTRMKETFDKEGTRKTVESIIIVHEHNHPHILLLQMSNSYFKLPGGKLKPGENEVDGLIRKLTKKLSPIGTAPDDSPWEIGELVSTWWRPSFEQHTFYPYIPPHISKPKECKKLYVVTLPEKCTFAVPQNLKLIAVPLFELYNNQQRYGSVISSIPQLISKYRYVYLSLDEK
ncbi:NUDIX hydrolase family protein [Cavenderia fasciculata]|uniref:Cleavage and polyadenylation specificity factor subunit 5 n=1 Tax=Cavenderia fasciculata TaxID=261658 RepID=F4PLZ3_CACFS|nr:NUDIX hydrolase family protein [Cavenderia fasciculata]EGG23547.1 NUDIX hydrolase family protein [Cavenderia fasciculata]|eukprot:XP_004361398.1 NUDIX hydrolase family protein [Cavenderia fasciculata]